MRIFENVPLTLTQLVNPDEYNQPQAAVSDIYNQIALDLEEAIPGLPEATIASTGGRN